MDKSVIKEVYKNKFLYFVKKNLGSTTYILFNELLMKDNPSKEKIKKLLSSSLVIENTATAFTDYIFDYITNSGDVIYG